MSNNESEDMYLETIYIMELNYGHAHVAKIAKELDVSKPSVTKAMKKLKDKGLINKEAYGSITLTESGKKVSEKIHRDHQLITAFLEHSLKLDSNEAEKNACRIEHIIDDEMLSAITNYLESHDVKCKC